MFRDGKLRALRYYVRQGPREAVCVLLGETENNGTLAKRLRRLRDSGKIDARLYSGANQLRMVRNDAAHDLSVVVSKDDARDCLEFVEAISVNVFVLDRKFQEFTKRSGAGRGSQAS